MSEPTISIPAPLAAELRATAQAELRRLAEVRRALEQKHLELTGYTIAQGEARARELQQLLEQLARCPKSEAPAESTT